MLGSAHSLAKFAVVIALLALAAGCVGPREFAAGTGAVIGDGRGGRISRGVDDVPAAMKAVVAHCAQFGKRGMVTQMDAPSQGGLLVFECH